MTDKAPETIRLIYKAKNLEDSKKVSDYSKYSFWAENLSLGAGSGDPYGKLGPNLACKPLAPSSECLIADTTAVKPDWSDA